MSRYCLQKALAVSYACAAYHKYNKFILSFYYSNSPSRFPVNWNGWDGLSNVAVILASCLNTQSYDFHDGVIRLSHRLEEKSIGLDTSKDVLKSLFGSSSSSEYACLFRSEITSSSGVVALLQQLFPVVTQFEHDKTLVASLKINLAYDTGYSYSKLGETAYSYLKRLLKELPPNVSSSLRSEDIEKMNEKRSDFFSEGRMIERLLNLAGKLSDMRQFQKFLQKILEEICLPLQAELGFSPTEIGCAITSCAIAVYDMLRDSSKTQLRHSHSAPDSSITSRKGDLATVSRDWLRFMAAIRLCSLNWIDPGFRNTLSAAMKSI